MKPRITYNTYYNYTGYIKNFICPKIGSIRLVDLNRSHIQKLYNESYKEARSSARSVRIIMCTSIDYAIKIKILGINIARDVKIPRDNKTSAYRTINIKSEDTLNVDQVKELIEVSKGSPIYLHILFAVLMGLRKGEINGLKYSDIDYMRRTLKVQRQLGRDYESEENPIKRGNFSKQETKVKTRSSNRELEIPDILFEAIMEERKQYEKNRSRRINDQSNPFTDLDYFCCSTYGKPRGTSFHHTYFKELLKNNHLPNIRFHDLRATYCTILVNNNFNLKAVSKMMGHASEIISIDVYTDNTQIINDSVEKLESFIESVIPNDDANENEFIIDKDEI